MRFLTMAWSDLAAMATLGVILSGLIYMVLRSQLSTDFVTQAEYSQAHDETKKRLGDIEQRLERMPTHGDIQAIAKQLSDVGTQVAVVGEQAKALKESVARIEHQLNLFLQAQLERESR